MRILEHFLKFVHVKNLKVGIKMFQISNKNSNSTGFLNKVKKIENRKVVEICNRIEYIMQDSDILIV